MIVQRTKYLLMKYKGRSQKLKALKLHPKICIRPSIQQLTVAFVITPKCFLGMKEEKKFTCLFTRLRFKYSWFLVRLVMLFFAERENNGAGVDATATEACKCFSNVIIQRSLLNNSYNFIDFSYRAINNLIQYSINFYTEYQPSSIKLYHYY